MPADSRSPRPREALRRDSPSNGVSFGVEAGTCFGLLGPNGAGKTTTVEIMEGILPATRGEVLYRGEPAGARFRAEAGIQFQNTALQDFLTVRESLTLFRSLYPRGPHGGRGDPCLCTRETRGSGQPQALRRPTPAPAARARPGERSGSAVPGRAHHRPRSPGAAQLLGPDPHRSRPATRP